MGVNAKTTQIYEALSIFNDEKNWNIASSKNIDLMDKFLKNKLFDTGIQKFDEIVKGIEPGTTIGIPGKSIGGKTALSIAIASTGLKQGFKVLHIDTDGDEVNSFHRYLSNLNNRSMVDVINGEGDFCNGLVIKRYNEVDLKLNNTFLLYERFTGVKTATPKKLSIFDVIKNEFEKIPFDIIVIDNSNIMELTEHRELVSFTKNKRITLINTINKRRDGNFNPHFFDIIIDIQNRNNNILDVELSYDNLKQKLTIEVPFGF
jgi:archaellum biogenesis ATPase FlaH